MHHPDEPVARAVLQPRRLAILAILAASPRGTVRRDRLTVLLWRDMSSRRANHRLADAVFELRAGLGSDAIEASAGTLVLNQRVVGSDVGELHRAFGQRDWLKAASLYHGAFLDGFFVADAPEFERWVAVQRERLWEHAGLAMEMYVQQCESDGDWNGALQWLRMLARHDPFSTRIALRLVEALATLGDTAVAVRCARAHQMLLREELGVEPDPQLAHWIDCLTFSRAPEGTRLSSHLLIPHSSRREFGLAAAPAG